MPSLAENIASVKDRVYQAAQDANSATNLPRIIAVSKTRSAEEVKMAADSGILDFGENYLQEALEKIENTQGLGIRWHFIGAIQSNKTNAIANHFDWVQSVDRLKIAQRLSEQRLASLPPLSICIQVNLDEEPTKAGISPAELKPLAAELVSLPKLTLRGIMCIPMPRCEYNEQLQACKKAVDLFNDLKQLSPDIDTLSLGMSADLQAAVCAGSTMVRIGTDIFGKRT